MKAQVLYGVGDIRYEDIEEPKLQEGWVIVQVMAAGVCGSDIPRAYMTGAHVHPIVIGHEFSGCIARVSEGSAHRVGERVGIFPLIPCGECECCRKKQYEMCSNYNYLGSRCNGGFAEYAAVPEGNLIALPDNVTYRQAAMLEPMAVAAHAMRQFPVEDGARVCVIGLGTIGLLLTLLLKSEGIKDVYVFGNKASQREYAAKLGIDDEHYGKCAQGADYVFECVGKSDTVVRAVNMAAPAGHVVLVGNPYSDMTFPKEVYWKILRRQLKVSGTWNSSYTRAEDDDWNYVLKKLARGEIRPQDLITHEYSLKDIVTGMEIMRDKTENYVKVMCVN